MAERFQVPRLSRPESARMAALALLALLLLGLALLGRRQRPPEPLWAGCPQEQVGQDPRSATLICGSGGPLSARQALLLGRPLDLSRAEAEDLEALPGIGPELARRIVEARAARGGFRRVEELLEVKGIGPKTLEKLSGWVVTGSVSPGYTR